MCHHCKCLFLFKFQYLMGLLSGITFGLVIIQFHQLLTLSDVLQVLVSK